MIDKIISCHTCKHNGKKTCIKEYKKKCLYGDKVIEYNDWKKYSNYNYSLWVLADGFEDFIDKEEMEI